MLQLVLGTAGTGKSSFIKEKIVQNAEKGVKSLFIVPEQFSKTGEAEIYSSLEKSNFAMVQVFSFKSLLRDVQSERGDVPVVVLEDGGKAVMAQKSMASVQKHLTAYHSQRQNIQFSFGLAEIFEDFKRNGVPSDLLYKLAEKAPGARDKLKDIALIYSQYCAQMSEAVCDTEQLLVQLSETLPEQYTHDTEIFIDGFENFSYGQRKIIGRMLEKSAQVYVALTAAEIYDQSGGTHPLSYTSKTAQRLVLMAKKVGVSVLPPITLTTQHRFLNPVLQNIDNFLLQKPLVDSKDASGAFVKSFATQFEEVSYLCGQIHQLTKAGYLYDDIAVVCPQLDKYEHQIQESMSLAKLPYFIDQNRIITSSAPVILFKSILEIMDGGVNENTILPLLKTGLTCFDAETTDFLEHYLYVWQDQNLDWQAPFTFPFPGISQGDKENAPEILSGINTLVHGVREVIYSYSQPKTEYLGKEILEKLYQIIEEFKSEDILSLMITNTQDSLRQELLKRQWETVITCVDQLYHICKDMVLRPREMQELFMLMVAGTEVGFAPETQDCILVSSPQRMKIDSVKVVFVLGASQDIFPSIVSEGTLLNGNDRQYLKENDIELGSDFIEKFTFENLYFYKTLTTARELLYISCAEKNLDSQEVISAEIEGLAEALSLPYCPLELEDYCITPEFFLQYVSEVYGIQGKEILNQLGIAIPTLSRKDFMVRQLEYIQELLGDHLIISPTAAENYYKCAFSYFIKNILKIYPIEKASLTQREAGDFLHWVAQNVLEKYGENYYKIQWQQVEQDIEQVVHHYLAENYPEEVRSTPRFKALSRGMHENATHLLHYIHKEQQSGLFRPIAFEKRIGFDSDIKPISMALENGKKVSVVGVCDRIDCLSTPQGNYVRIVDYKTGTKNFDLDEVWNGLSTQLLLYMSSVLQSGNQFVKNPKAGAVMYQPSDAAFKFDNDGQLYTPVGMALADSVISHGFDQDYSGSFGVICGEDKVKKVAGSVVTDAQTFEEVLNYTQEKVKEMAQKVYQGDFDSLPLDLGNGHSTCDFCGYGCICQELTRSKEKEKAKFGKKEEKEDGNS